MNSASWPIAGGIWRSGTLIEGRGEEIVTYIIDRNINYTNVCNVYCKFCAFYRTEKDEDHYVLSLGSARPETGRADGDRRRADPPAGRAPSRARDRLLSHDALAHIRRSIPHINIHAFQPAGVQSFRGSLRDAAARGDHRISRKRAWARFPAAAGRFWSIGAQPDRPAEVQERPVAGSDARSRTSWG